MSPLSFLVDPYADTLELPVSGELPVVSARWEHEQIINHLGAQFQVVREIGRGGMGVVFLRATSRCIVWSPSRSCGTSSRRPRSIGSVSAAKRG